MNLRPLRPERSALPLRYTPTFPASNPDSQPESDSEQRGLYYTPRESDGDCLKLKGVAALVLGKTSLSERHLGISGESPRVKGRQILCGRLVFLRMTDSTVAVERKSPLDRRAVKRLLAQHPLCLFDQNGSIQSPRPFAEDLTFAVYEDGGRHTQDLVVSDYQ